MYKNSSRSALAAACAMLSGCGLFFQGTSKNIRVEVRPAGASVQFGKAQVTSPASLTVSRRIRGHEIYRIRKEGYRPACGVNNCEMPRWIRVVDSIPAALPLLFDVTLGTLGNCKDIVASLNPVREYDVPYELPSDAQIPNEEGAAETACLFPYLYDSSFATKAERILVSAGPLQQSYEILGNVDFGKQGFDRVDAGAVITKSFVYAWANRTFSKATPSEINSLLRKRALYQYGRRVDALINVNYQSDPANSVFATAVAVRFSDDKRPASPAARLKEIDDLRDGGRISESEYQEKRGEILRGL